MTCREKFNLEQPGRSTDQICPSTYGYLPDPNPEWCHRSLCDDCWDREIHEEKVTNTYFEYPCRNCNVGWHSISTEGSKSCQDTCERLAEYNRQRNNKGETMNGTNIMLCTTCMHRAVCKNTEEFRIAQLAIANMKVDLGGDNNVVRLCDIPYIKPVELQCKYFRKETITR